MAKAEMKMPEDFLLKVSRLGEQTDAIIAKSLEAGGEVVLSKVKSNLSSVIGKGTKQPSRATGELQGALGLSGVKVSRDGVHNIKVGFNKPRRKQSGAKGKRSYTTATNSMIANVIEYGKHGQAAKPFLKPAKTASRRSCITAMQAALEEEISKI